MKKLFLLISAIVFSCSAIAQATDAEGCKDHALFTRLSNHYIESCTSNYNAVTAQIGASNKTKSVEGNVTTINYVFNTESGAKMPSPLQIIKNFENAIVSKGGKKIYQGVDDVDGGPLGATFNMSANGTDYWVLVRKMYEPLTNGEVGSFNLVVIEMEGMKQEIEASEMFKEISKSGHIALYVNFETGKADIKPESQKVIEQLAQMLKENAGLKVSIEGHTDNAGNAAANQTLSENRAKAVMNAVIAKGIDKSRLVAKGSGQTKPIADNGTEDGKAKNRRVEIVKM
jgi:OOP family OmpA-OmpF porin